MRLYNMYYLCKKCKSEIESLVIKNTRSQVYTIENWGKYKDALFVLRQIPFLRDSIDDLYGIIPVFVRERDKPEIDNEITNKLFKKNDSILLEINTVISLYESLELGEGSNGIDVKIPSCNSLDEYIGYLKEIDFIFTQCPFLQHKDGMIKFNSVDVGSQWLTFVVTAAVGTAAVTYILNNIAMLVDKAIQLKSHLNNLNEQEEIIRNRKLQNDTLESSVEIFDTLKKYYLSEAVKDMQNENTECKLNDGEEVGKAEKSLEKLCGLIDKGVEIYASIGTDKEIQVLFPAMGDKVELSDDIIKYLEDKTQE